MIVIEGSGRLADEVAELKKLSSQIEDPMLAEIVEEGDLRIFPMTGALEDFERMLFSQSPNIKLLRDAWQRFATYDANGGRLQQAFKNIQFWILVLGLIAGFISSLIVNRRGEGMLLDICHLIDSKSIEKYQNRYSSAAKQLKNCEIAISGPWPPYHFMPGKLRTVS